MPSNNNALYFKWGTILIIFIGALWLLNQLGCYGGGGKTKSDTISHKFDTVFVTSTDTILIDNPIPYKVTYWKEKVFHDTLETVETILQDVDSAKILAQYLAKRDYDTTVNVNYGSLRMRATVTQNRVINSRFDLSQDIPFVKETVTMLQPKRVVLLMGIQAIGNKYQLPFASGITLDLKLRNDAIIGGGAYLTGDRPMFSAAIKFPVRLRKR